MSQLQNQFKQAAQKGLVDLKLNTTILSVIVDSTSAGGLVAGQCLKLIDSAGGVPKVVELAADTDKVFGVILYNIKNATYKAGDSLELVVMRNSVLFMEASAAIARGAAVMPVVTGSKVATATSGKPVLGHALDKAAADGDLIRVVVDLGSDQAATVAAVATADATDLPSAEALANANKVAINAILVALKAAGMMK